jgi:hypothetical protein
LGVETIQIYESYTDSSPQYGSNVCLIGRCEKGEKGKPFFTNSYEMAVGKFGEGDLTRSFKECKDAGAKNIFLVKVGDNEEELSEESIEVAYRIIEGFPVHIVCLVGIYLDEPDRNYALQLAKHCRKSLNQYGDRIGVIGVRLANLEELFSHVSDLSSNELISMGLYDEDGVDIGYLVSAVASEVNYLSYSANGAAAYAGLLSSLRPGQNPLNRSIQGSDELRYLFPTYNVETIKFEDFTLNEEVLEIELEKRPERPIHIRDEDHNIFIEGVNYEIDFDRGVLVWLDPQQDPQESIRIVYSLNDYKTLSSAGYTIFSEKVNRGIVVESCQTLSKKSSFKDISVIRILQSIAYTIKNVCQDLIGETVQQVLEVEDFIEDYLMELVYFQEIYSYQLGFSIENFHTVNINLAITTNAGVKKLSVGINVSK